MSRIGFGRHAHLEEGAGDPLDGLVNLFDVGIVLAVAFLVAGLSLKSKAAEQHQQQTSTNQTTITTPAAKQTASGKGQALGQVYRLPDGRLVLVGADGKPVAP